MSNKTQMSPVKISLKSMMNSTYIPTCVNPDKYENVINITEAL